MNNEKVLSFKEFKLSFTEPLLKQGKRKASPLILVEAAHSAKKKKEPAAPIPSKCVRKDERDHWLGFDEKKRKMLISWIQ